MQRKRERKELSGACQNLTPFMFSSRSLSGLVTRRTSELRMSAASIYDTAQLVPLSEM